MEEEVTYLVRPRNLVSIREFYKNSRIFITGATGVVGKLLVRKILKTYPEVGHIYLLIRDKDGKNASERMSEYFNDSCFDEIKEDIEEHRKKVSHVRGNVEIPYLGLTYPEVRRVLSKITVIFYIASSQMFSSPLRENFKVNVKGLKRIVALSQNTKTLKAIIYVSTSYPSFDTSEIREEVYSHNASYDRIKILSECWAESQISRIASRFLADYPNYHTFTKSLAERELVDGYGSYPIGIFRPGIGISSYKEPDRGWVTTCNEVTYLAINAAQGYLHVMTGNKNIFANVVPMDMIINGIIASAWDVSSKMPGTFPVYNFTPAQQALTWREFFCKIKYGMEYPLSNSVWHMYVTMTTSRVKFALLQFFMHKLPAWIADFRLTQKKQRTIHIARYQKMNEVMKRTSYYFNIDWSFENSNVQRMWELMTETERKELDIDIFNLDWDDYFEHYLKGMKKYLLKDKEEELEVDRRKQKNLEWIHKSVVVLFVLSIIYLLWY